MTPVLVPSGGSPETLGATVTAEGVVFAVYSETAEWIAVCLFDAGDREITRFRLDGREGAVHFGLVGGLGAGARYGLRADGPWAPERGLWFDPDKLLVDPYARRVDRVFHRQDSLGRPRGSGVDTAPDMPKAIVPGEPRAAANPIMSAPGLFYELNVRGYTLLHPDVPRPLRGTIEGLMSDAVVKHLSRLGVTTVELMPVAAWIDDAHLPALGLSNAWGYNPVTYFAPDPRLAPSGMADVRALTDLYRAHGIGVILDVVYNHTGEGDAETGLTLSLRGLDAPTYYRHFEADGRLRLVNDTGTGNTLRCDHPAVQRLVIESLRYWVEEGGVSGFRFDLAPILGRTPGFDPEAELLRMLREDPVLKAAVLVAEPWDPGPGGYQLGRFGEPFMEWNDRYRDDVRSFWRGDGRMLGRFATRLAGSEDVFGESGRGPAHGVNLIAVHDGFTLADLVSHASKWNIPNGEDNRDGHDHNFSWNGGAEGRTDDPDILDRRRADMRALLATLFVSRGTPLLQQGDEFGRTQAGNNNAYAQDNATTWVDWAGADHGLIGFVARLVALRAAHPALRADRFLSPEDVDWLRPGGGQMADADWNAGDADVLGMCLREGADVVLVWFNRRHIAVDAELPRGDWTLVLSSADGGEIARGRLILPPRSVSVLVLAERVQAAAKPMSS
ncbi:glycogen debranching enzyme GlgX [Arsenicitalea aurantiaca]|uniref:Glycogen debranching enzyme GlgX n=1 Tax=Arsenicitalea aurantiaca TaxID=1783274 RepID=A0A433XLZ3_9HYPH|nr:glycogen debranching protein GlgX [Arsenicitalea aurantiaca]RUT35073.1 glycogen debranching enzyme GlgX [Arsenicitalea aurantiaca]